MTNASPLFSERREGGPSRSVARGGSLATRSYRTDSRNSQDLRARENRTFARVAHSVDEVKRMGRSATRSYSRIVQQTDTLTLHQTHTINGNEKSSGVQRPSISRYENRGKKRTSPGYKIGVKSMVVGSSYKISMKERYRLAHKLPARRARADIFGRHKSVR